MAWNLQGLCSAAMLAVLVVLLCCSPAEPTSRRAFPWEKQPTGFVANLKHVDHGKNLTKMELLQRGVKRGAQKLQRLNAAVLAESGDGGGPSLSSPVHAGNGEFLMSLSIGTPPEKYSAIVDTGSDLIWTQCKPCQQCYNQPNPIFDPSKSSSYKKLPCTSNLCSALAQSSCGSDGCDYLYTYGDYSSTQGVMGMETFTFGDDEEVSIPGIGFGCGEDNEGDGFVQGAGLVGLGRGPLSLVSQLKEPKFSYCLTSIDEDKSTSKLLMGSLAEPNASLAAAKTTPLLRNAAQPTFYYVALKGISVGNKPVSVDESIFKLQVDGTGGMIVDSGTTITYLVENAFEAVKKQFASQVKLPIDDSGSTGLDLCFKVPSGTTSVEVPKLVFHFNGADVELPGENYMIGDSSMGVLCLAMGASSGMSIFGNVQQQNILMIHDLAKETLSFVPTKCSQL